MKNLTLENISRAVEGKLYTREGIDDEELLKEASSLVIDSRKAEAGGIFIATKGERVDGHSFIPQVIDKGVLGVICERKPENVNGNIILVKDSLKALRDLAKYYKEQLKAKTIGIIGSVGKTSTKEMVASVMSEAFKVTKTQGNFNNAIGVPLTIFSMTEETELAVIEMGISDFGEMSVLGDMVKPDYVVMTNIGPCHLEQLKDLDGVLKAKTEVFDFIKEGGRAILNGDDEKLKSIKSAAGREPVFYGRSDKNSIYAKSIRDEFFEGIDVEVGFNRGAFNPDKKEEDSLRESFNIHIPLPGLHMVDNALAAIACGLEFSMDIEAIKRGIEKVEGTKGRSNPIYTGKYLLVDDCYNANPKSMKAALDLLSKSEKRKAAILGDMFELGENSAAMHADIGKYAVNSGVKLLLIAGENSLDMYKEALKAKEACKREVYIRYFEDTDKLINALSQDDLIKQDDVVLVKASHGMHFESVVDKLSVFD
ncbi:MAG: UDP-N-acetylmuramoyl-tripeptide--D-alanyl-D-alanine ligase [Lachnospiraceae bacterium]|nr:UDP-N-acetylmuramoyl-tripeptide--D-alanyl-D-alanine ligase [Lachnospiraceae bacterium]